MFVDADGWNKLPLTIKDPVGAPEVKEAVTPCMLIREEVIFDIKSAKDIDKISDLVNKEGTTEVKINIKDKFSDISFKLKNKRLIDRKAINILRNNDISTIIH